MEKLRRLFGRHGFDWFGLGLFAIGVSFVFWQVLPKFSALVSPDAGPFFVYAYKTNLIEKWLTGVPLTPHSLYFLLFPPLYAHELTYILDSLVLCLAGVYYLRGLRLHPLAAWVGGFALGLCGYTFTLFSAGHRGYFHMFSCSVWAFGFLLRCFERRKVFHFAALGLVLAWGATCQPDVLVLVGLVAAAYALWLTVRVRRPDPGSFGSLGGGWRPIWDNMLAVWPRFLISVALMMLVGFGSLRAAVTTTMANRDAQIAGVAAAAPKVSGEAQAMTSEKDRRERWLFATGWSLPPEDVLEFVAPGVYGDESMQMPYPYWGRLGRPAGEAFQKGRMMPNYRQHTVYLGAVSILLALLGLSTWLSQRKTQRVSGKHALSDREEALADFSDVPFWCGVWVVCLLLSFGSFTPLYRLFYALPYMDYIRAPVKFHHLVELATAMLAGFGMEAFLRAPAALRRRLVILAGGLAAALFLGAGVMLANKAAVVSHIASLGLGPVSSALGSYAVQNLMRSVGLSVVVAGLALAAGRASARWLERLGCLMLALLAADQALVARRYVRAINVEPFYQANALVSAIKRDAGDRFVNVVNYVTPNAWAQEWFSTALSLNGILNYMPAGDERNKPLGKLFTTLEKDPVRFWRLCGVEYVIVPRKGVDAFIRAGVLTPVLDFELGQGVVRQTAPSADSLILARVREATGLPVFTAGWTGSVPVAGQAEVLAKDGSHVSDAPISVAVPVGAGAGEVRVLSSRGQPGKFATRVRVSAKSPGLLIFNERYVDGLEVLVDGVPGATYVADCCWPAALVPQGEHEVTLRLKRNFAFPLVGLLATVAVFGWGGLQAVRAGRAVPAGQTP